MRNTSTQHTENIDSFETPQRNESIPEYITRPYRLKYNMYFEYHKTQCVFFKCFLYNSTIL